MNNLITQIIKIPASEVEDSKVNIRREFQFPTSQGVHVTAVRVYEVSGKVNEYSLGLRTDSKLIQSPTYKEEWLRTTESSREKPIYIEDIAGKNLNVELTSVAAFTADLELHFVFSTED